ncbi:hypothetical protein CB1_000353025 [Camelus ferus]|nr:hypothetical protein CB1_000353025 [Camelus ferus]
MGSVRKTRYGLVLMDRLASEPYCCFKQVCRCAYGPEHWVTSSVSCGGRNQSPIDILDQHARVGEEYQELQLDGFDNESSNKTWMKNTGKTVAILLKDDYFVSGAGLPGRFKAEKVEFHWGHSNGSAGSEHSINGRRFPVEVRETQFASQTGTVPAFVWKSFIYSRTGGYPALRCPIFVYLVKHIEATDAVV